MSVQLPPHYTLLKKLGRGGSGEVFLVQEKKTTRKAALKLLFETASLSAEFQGEIAALRTIRHRHIVELRDHGFCEKRPYLVFEYIPGISLREYLENNPLPRHKGIQLLGNYMLQLAGAIDHLHAAGLVHRDLKPENILLTPAIESEIDLQSSERFEPALKIKLLDFGFVRNRNLTETEKQLHHNSIGTLGYCAPEQLRSPELSNERCDLFSFGVMLYECCTGTLPYEDLNQLLGSFTPPSPHRLNPQVPPELSSLIAELIDTEALNRPVTIAETARRLESTLFPDKPVYNNTEESNLPPLLDTARIYRHLTATVTPPTQPSEALLEHLQKQTGGDTRVVLEYLSFLFNGRLITRTFGELVLNVQQPPEYAEGSASFTLPEEIEESWNTRTASFFSDLTAPLTAEEKQTLCDASCFAGSFHENELATLQMLSLETVRNRLIVLEKKGFLQERAAWWSFRSALIKHYFEQSFDPALKKKTCGRLFELHRQTASPERLALYLLKASRHDEAARFFLEGALTAFKKGACKKAVAILERALSLGFSPAPGELADVSKILLQGGRPRKALALLSSREAATERGLQRTLLMQRGTAERMCGDMEAAHQSFTSALPLCDEKSAGPDALKVHSSLAAVSRSLGKADDAEHSYAAMEQLASKINNAAGKIEALHGRGLLAKAKGDRTKAENFLRQACEEAHKQKDLRRYAIARNNLGNVLRSLGKHDEASACFREAVEARTSLGDRRGVAIIHNNLAQELIYHGDLDAALKEIAESYRLFLETGDLKGQIISLGNRGTFLGLLGDITAAVLSLDRAVQLAQRTGDTLHRWETETQCCRLLGLHHPEKALSRLAELMERNTLPAPLLLMAWNCRAAVHFTADELTAASDANREAVRLLDNSSDIETRLQVATLEAEILLALQKPDEGLEAARNAFDTLSETITPFMRGRVLRILGEAWLEMGPEWADRTEAYLTQAHTLLAGISYKHELARTKAALALYMLYIEEEEESRRLAQEAQKLFRELHSPRELAAVTTFLNEEH